MVTVCPTAGFGGAGSFGIGAATLDSTLRETFPIGMFIASFPVTQREIGNNGSLGAGKVHAQLCFRACRCLTYECKVRRAQAQQLVERSVCRAWQINLQLATTTAPRDRIDVRPGAATRLGIATCCLHLGLRGIFHYSATFVPKSCAFENAPLPNSILRKAALVAELFCTRQRGGKSCFRRDGLRVVDDAL